ncbi:MAG: beta-ketoacyl-ACP synthase II [Spirochaetota bacterium]|uniref:3-oxoacyl-[acyl-carrier-protein] synthase 2 n=1 Tax=Sphaerochaeta associata TaxID=1129264 RepID=A0ABY4DBL9_9SPIR|nr:beta-ketoacyl-ACP synthase II [Sphaerochaeta associata]MDT3359358.1 beta-ketoacyl-ACP synthase II [Spirochaetota bacterium]UOM51663.1 beta-ketoacyl-ACP synthase II [Sphaerochaeta associata]SMP52425.1 3-oxoacyl-[acyl-carrier-protein] synthase II [Sphaerochaeta associata]
MIELERVVVTGMGTVNPLGTSITQFWDNIKAGVSGVGPITKFDTADYPAKIAGEVRDFDPSDLLDRKETRGMADFTKFAVHASVQAMQQAGLDKGGYDPYRSGVYLGNGIGGFEVVEENMAKLFERGPHAVAPLTIPKLISNEAAGNIAIHYNFKGPCHTTVTACASGTDAIGDAFNAIRFGQVDVALTGGTEAAITKLSVAGFCRLQALATKYNDTPQIASRPFDKERDGFVMGEGAGMLVLESLSHAKARGAVILGEIAGYSMTCDAFHLTAPNPDGEGAARAMKAAVEMAGAKLEEVDYINAHGTSTAANDSMETKAIKSTFGSHAYNLKVSSTKSMTSHLIAAAGAVEAIVCLLAIRDQYFPCTLNLTNPDTECDLDYVPNQGREGTIRYAMSNSLGFGGHNGVLVFKAFKPL